MTYLSIPNKLQEEIVEYFSETLLKREEQADFDRFLQLLSPSKRDLIYKSIFKDKLKQNVIFKTLVDEAKALKSSCEFQLNNSQEYRAFYTKKKTMSIARISRVENYLIRIILFLGTVLTQPEDEIITYDDEDRDLYFIMNGNCVVRLKNELGRDYISDTLLDEGDHFGEISLAHKCRRTATVISRSYNTLGKLSYLHYREVAYEFPELAEIIRQYIQTYDDSQTIFRLESLKKIELLSSKLTQSEHHETIYKFKKRNFKPGEIIIKAGTSLQSIFIVEFGSVEAVTECDGHEFIVDWLQRGTLINSRSFHTEECLEVTIRAREYCQLLELDQQLI